MAGRSFVQLLGAADPGVVILGFSFLPQGTGAISSSKITGRGVASVAWSTDRYVITLQDVYPYLLGGSCELQLATASGVSVQFGAINLANKTIEVVAWDPTAGGGTGAATSVAANAGNKIHIILVLKNSGV